MTTRSYRARTPFLPPYSHAILMLEVLDGVPRVDFQAMMRDIYAQTGTPQAPLDWTDPDQWISERLRGVAGGLADKIWKSTRHHVNPRYADEPRGLLEIQRLVEVDEGGAYRISERGSRLMENDPALLREIDHDEGMGELLSMLATKTRAMRKDLLPEWSEFMREHSRFQAASSIKDALHRRLLNLAERRYVERTGNSYFITPKGIEYAAGFTGVAEGDPSRDLFRAIKGYNEAQLHALRERLGNVPPVQFEHMVSDLLSAMGYEDVRVTQQSGDRGVDVVATVQFGITTITEVVQVKRYRGSIGRPILDQLRGALPYHHAQRGTMITLGTFSSGCKEAALFPGAAPITLIDGDRLLALLVEHEVGVQKRHVALVELDEEYLRAAHGSGTSPTDDGLEG